MRFFRDLLLTAGSIVVLLLLSEFGLRATGSKYESSFYENDPVLYMRFRPNARGWEAKEGENFVQINSAGMRDRERSLDPSPGTTRIALLGDSMVVAEQVPLEKTMGQVLERNLNTRLLPNSAGARSIEVLNFGVGGYTLAQEYLMLKNRVWAFHPRVVLLILSPSSVPSCNRRLYPADIPYFIVRDGQTVADPRNRPPAASSAEARRQHAIFGDLMNRSRLLQMIRKATQDGIPHEIAHLRGTKPSRNFNIMSMWFHPPETPEQQEAWQVAEGLLTLMAQETHQHGAEFWISTVGNEIEEDPDSGDRQNFMRTNGITNFDYSESRLQSIAAVHGIRYISMEPALLQYSEQHGRSLRGFFNTEPNRGHWNEEGNAAAAGVVAQALLGGSRELHPDQSSVAGSSGVVAPESETVQARHVRKLVGTSTASLHP